MNTTELEFAISQYVDGTLPRDERAALDEVLAADANARALLAEYQSLQATLRNALPVPTEIDYEALGARISSAVAEEEPPVRHLAMPWVRSSRVVAVAASVLLAIGVGVVIVSLNNRPTTEVTGPTIPTETPTMVVTGPQVQGPAVPSVQQVTVGPSEQLASNWRYGEAVVSRPARVLIYSAVDPAQDNRLLY